MRRSIKLTFLYACRALGFFAIARRFVEKKLLILCYHGFEVADEASFRPKLFMKPELFRKRLDVLSKSGMSVIGLSVALDHLANGSLPPNSVAITIDDGFYSTYSVAYPMLAEKDFRATLYVASYYVVKGTPVFRARRAVYVLENDDRRSKSRTYRLVGRRRESKYRFGLRSR